MERNPKNTYTSHKILGQLYDSVQKVDFRPSQMGTFDQRVLAHPINSILINTVRSMKTDYDESMRRIMAQHQIATEFEVWSTFVLHHSKAARDFKFHEEIGQHAKTLKDQFYDAFVKEAGGDDFEKLEPYAIVAYHITNEEYLASQKRDSNTSLARDESKFSNDSDSDESDAFSTRETTFISFPWVLQEMLQKIATRTTTLEEMDQVNAKKSSGIEGEGGKGAETDAGIDSGFTVRTWNYCGEHLPDPYVPVAATSQKGDTISASTTAESVPDIKPFKEHIAQSMPEDSQNNRQATLRSQTATKLLAKAASLNVDPGVGSASISGPSADVGAATQAETIATRFKDPAEMTEDELKAMGNFSKDDDFGF
jgi:hypothetical protein